MKTEQIDDRTYRVTHPDETESYSARDARDILRERELIPETGVSVTWIGSDLYRVEPGGETIA